MMKTQLKKTPFARTGTLAVVSLWCAASLWLYGPAAFAAGEICASCGQQVSGSGDFAHHKDAASVALGGAGNNAEAFREEINGKHFTVSIAHLPAGKYTIAVGKVEKVADAPGERVFDVVSGRVTAEVPAERLRGGDTPKKQYIVESGKYEFLVGAASDDIRLRLPMTMTG